MEKITFCIPSKNNLRYLKSCIPSIRKNAHRKDHDIIVFVDKDTDGTVEWLNEVSEQLNVRYIVNPDLNNSLYGIGRAYDKCIAEATTDLVVVFHADMYLCKDADLKMYQQLTEKSVVCATRIEPPLHPPGPEKIVQAFGTEPEEFNEAGLLKWFNDTRLTRKDKTTEGIFAPWAIYKSDFQSIGGHDDLYAPQSKEDSDIFNRFLLNGYKFIQTWEGCVYHMTCRGSRYNPTLTTVGKESDEWLAQNNRSARNFIRKWGHFVKHNDVMKPIVPNRYDVGFVVRNCDEYKLALLEPWCDTIYTDVPYDRYINAEQKNTKFNLTKKLKRYEDQKLNDVIIEFDATKISSDSFEFFNMIQLMLEDSGQVGTLEYDIFKLSINKLNTYSKQLIEIKDEWYNKKLL